MSERHQRILDATHVYIARKQCGCVVGAATDCGDKTTADFVRDFIKSGYTIERLTFPEYRTCPAFGCKCNKIPEQAELFA